MNSNNQIFRFILFILISAGSYYTSASPAAEANLSRPELNNLNLKSGIDSLDKMMRETKQMNDSLMSLLSMRDLEQSRFMVDRLLVKIHAGAPDDAILSESYYLIGMYHLLTRGFYDAIRYLDSCISIKEKYKEYDTRYARALNNKSAAYAILGDLKNFEYYALKSLETGRKILGDSNPELISYYLSLLIVLTDLTEYEKAISNSNLALTIADKNPDRVPPQLLADLYYSLGVCYNRLGDYSKAKIYFDRTESIYGKSGLNKGDNFINLMNGQAIISNSLGFKEESAEYYEKGVSLAISRNSSLAFNIINSYCVFLGNDNKAEKGEKLLKNALDRAKASSEITPRNYIEVLNNYAGYLREYKIDIKKSIESYEKCLAFLKKNDQDKTLKAAVYLGYSHALEDAGEPEKALEIIQSLLFPQREISKTSLTYDNPPSDSLKPDITSLRILKIKYGILWDIYIKMTDQQVLEAASSTSELIVSLIDKVRINISEEESRLILGDQYRDSYLNSIRDFNLLYTKTAEQQYLEKAFEYSERSKVAGLLTSTRELKASQFHIPADIGNTDRELQREISLLNARISEESSAQEPDTKLISDWKENLLKDSRKRDSLILVLEKEYPEYYAMKYSTHMVGLKDIPGIIGSKGNYINYVVSNTVLYTFIVNKKYQRLLAIPIDSSFFSDVRQFRSLLSMPSPSENAKLKFNEFQSTGNRLYKILIDPVRPYLISDKIVISPDNVLSYLPFETLPLSGHAGNGIFYRDLKYLMNEFNISYTYSATFMAESVKKEGSRNNKLIAFAPDYPWPIDVRSVLMSRQEENGMLSDLPFARLEAKYVTDITGGTLFENSDAKESVFKKESGKYDIIHLAMHTLLNDKDPMRSTLIFSHINDSPEDGYLKTFEIYGIPLRAKMVVLSSCNTGTGQLFSGEGILSLARGFVYSGSQSVVMSMWEIEDKSGTEIVEMFYKYLKKGYPKSIALKKARIDFLKNADQLRSHPYFWSALVVYGNNTPIYYSHKLRNTIAVFIAILIVSLGYYFRKRKYS